MLPLVFTLNRQKSHAGTQFIARGMLMHRLCCAKAAREHGPHTFRTPTLSALSHLPICASLLNFNGTEKMVI